MSTKIRSMISTITSDAEEHFSTGDSRLSIHAGLSIISTWQAQAAGLRQMATRRSVEMMS